MRTPFADIALCACVVFLGACDKTTPAPPTPKLNTPSMTESGATTGAADYPSVPSAGSVLPPANDPKADPTLGKTDGTRKPKQESEAMLLPGQNNDHSAPLSPAK